MLYIWLYICLCIWLMIAYDCVIIQQCHADTRPSGAKRVRKQFHGYLRVAAAVSFLRCCLLPVCHLIWWSYDCVCMCIYTWMNGCIHIYMWVRVCSHQSLIQPDFIACVFCCSHRSIHWLTRTDWLTDCRWIHVSDPRAGAEEGPRVALGGLQQSQPRDTRRVDRSGQTRKIWNHR